MSVGRAIRAADERDVLLAFLLTAAMLLSSSSAFACSCAAYPVDEAKAVAMAYSRADAVFLGVVTGMKSRYFRAVPVRDAMFDVSASWKGVIDPDETVVRSAIGEIACGYRFVKRGRYLVFAYWNADQGIYWTNMCELTREEAQAPGLIKELDSLTKRRGAKSRPAVREAPKKK